MQHGSSVLLPEAFVHLTHYAVWPWTYTCYKAELRLRAAFRQRARQMLLDSKAKFSLAYQPHCDTEVQQKKMVGNIAEQEYYPHKWPVHGVSSNHGKLGAVGLWSKVDHPKHDDLGKAQVTSQFFDHPNGILFFGIPWFAPWSRAKPL